MRSADEFMDDFMTKLKNGEFDRLRGIFPEKKKYASYTLESYINWRDERVDDIISEEAGQNLFLLKKQLELKAVASGQLSAAVRNAEKLLSKANSLDEIDNVIEICDKNIRLCQRRLNGKLPDKSLMFKDKTIMQKGVNEFTRVRGKAVAKRKSLE